MSMVDRDSLPENLRGTFDDLNDFIEERIKHLECIMRHDAEIKRLDEEIQPRITLMADHLRESSHLRVFGEFMDSMEDKDGTGNSNNKD